MRRALLGLFIVLAPLPWFGGHDPADAASIFPHPSTEVVQLTAQKRARLEQLRRERKFAPHDFPPLGYTGAETEEDRAVATNAVDRVLSDILARQNGALPARTVSDLIGTAMKKVDGLATEDRDRTAGYLVEIWYILGFKGATGKFANGSAFVRPSGYAEPLPPGWLSPLKPRVIK